MRRRAAALALCLCCIGRLASSQPAQDLDPRVVTLVAQVSEPRLVALLKKLETFGTRNTLSSVDSPTRGIGAARQWIFDELKSYSPKLQVSFDTYRIAAQGRITREVEARNVMAILPGRSPRRIYISGHYDTIAINGGQSGSNAGNRGRDGIVVSQPADPNAPNDNPAAGVNDDGSGTALTIELARVFSQSGLEFDATLVFMCHVAEEQGLLGAKLHAQKARDLGIRIDAVLNNDIVGNARGGNGIIDGASIRVYSDGPEDSPSRELARFVQRWGMRYVPSHTVRPLARPDRFSRGGDHSAYTQYRVPRGRVPRIARGFQPAARPARHVRRSLAGVSRAERASQRGGGRDARPRAGGAGRPQRARSGQHQPRAVRIRCPPDVDRVSGRDGVPDFLARSLGP